MKLSQIGNKLMGSPNFDLRKSKIEFELSYSKVLNGNLRK